MQYVKSLDGIRGLAVSLVVLFHFGFFPAGWVGVQIFFVLSGYLITNILLLEKGRPFLEYVGRFYWRRSLRILPLYFAFLTAVLASYVAIRKPESFAADWPFLATYTTNFGRLRATDVGPAFIHLWSLAVEEQFYLVWPLLVYFMPSATFKRTIISVMVLSPFLRLTLYFAFQGYDADWVGRNIYCLSISQLDAFAAGAAIAAWRLQDALKNAGRFFLAALVVTAISGVAVIFHDHIFYKSAVKTSFGFSMYLLSCWGFVWGYSLLNTLFALGFICTLQRLRPLRLLENPALVRLGTISYGMYVYHVPMLLLFKTLPIAPGSLFVGYCAATVAISELSHRYLEAPFLAMKSYWMPSNRQQIDLRV